MQNLSIAEGLYLLHKPVSKTVAPVVTDIPTDHILCIDCSGSMSYELPKIRQQLKNKLSMMLKESDTVSIVWFSGKTQFGIVVENVPLHNAVDLTGVQRAIDNYLKPIGLTGFVEPLQEVEKLIGRVQKPGRATNLFFMSDGYDNQWSKEQILAAVDKLAPLVSSAAIVEYGWYCNRPLMVQMSERLGANEVFAENFPQYEPIFETAITKKIAGVKKVDVDITQAIHGFVFAIHDGEILTFSAEGRKVSVPEGLDMIYWFAELPTSANFITMTEINHPNCKPTTKAEILRALYASLIPLTQRMLSNDIFRVLKATGDVRLIREFSSCFGKQEYSEFQAHATECVSDETKRLVDGFNPDEVPAEDAYTIIDLLYELSGDEGNLFYPNHPAFDYHRTGRKAVESERMLTEAEIGRLSEIASEIGKTRDPARIKALQAELSSFTEQKDGLKFTPEDQDAGYPVSNLVFNEDRPNVSAQVRIPGTVDLEGLARKNAHAQGAEWCHDVPDLFPTSIVRNYTIIRDGIRNVKVLPVSLTEKSYNVLRDAGDFLHDPMGTGSWVEGHIYEIDLMKLPLINRTMVKDVSANDLFQKQWDLVNAKAKQKVFNYFFDEYFPPESAKGIADKYGVEAAAWLSELGVKDYGFSPKVTLAEATEAYVGKELAVSISGMSSLPSVKSVLDKLNAKKKLTTREIALCPAIAEVRGFIDGPTNKNVDEKTRNELLHVWLTSRKLDTITLCRKLMREIAQIKFSVIVGQVWFVDLGGDLNNNSLIMNFDGVLTECTANLREIEIKV
jgi:hypothetical protein